MEGYWDPVLEPWSVAKRLVAGPLTMWSSWAQPKKKTWVHPQMGPPPTGGAIEIQCYMAHVAVKGRGLGGPIPSC